MTRRGVLVVVPVYGDLPSVLECLSALHATIAADDRVLIVNDCGPDVDAIEAAILQEIRGRAQFRYERNSENLGFVGTCNRAVQELDSTAADVILLNSDAVPTTGFIDAMLDVLDADPHHGAVTARSNNATVASIPYRQTNRGAARSFERTAAVHAGLVAHLPQWYVAPTAMGFCLLIRRSLIEEFGLFDDVFAPGYGEENDFCMRIGAAGHRSLIANRALVFHAGSASFASRSRNALRAAHQKVLESRYPNWSALVSGFVIHGQRRIDQFADCLVPTDQEPRVAIDVRGLPADRASALLATATTAHAGWDIEVVERDAPNPDDLVSRVVVPLSSLLDAGRFQHHDARAAQWIVIDDVEAGSGPTYDAVRERRAASIRAVADQIVTDPLSIDSTVPVWGPDAIEAQSTRLERRHDLAMASSPSAANPSVDAAGQKAIRELAGIRASRSYRLARKISEIAAVRNRRRR